MTAAPAPAPGRLQRRKARTRSAIVSAATDLFHANGFDATSIQQIAERADIGVGTLYGYFASKDEILREVLRSTSDQALQRYFAAADEAATFIDRVCTAMDVLAEFIRDNRLVLEAAFQSSARDRRVDEHSTESLVASFCTLLQQGIEREEIGRIPVRTTAQLLVSSVTMAVLGLGIWSGREDDPSAVDELQVLARRLLNPAA